MDGIPDSKSGQRITFKATSCVAYSSGFRRKDVGKLEAGGRR